MRIWKNKNFFSKNLRLEVLQFQQKPLVVVVVVIFSDGSENDLVVVTYFSGKPLFMYPLSLSC